MLLSASSITSISLYGSSCSWKARCGNLRRPSCPLQTRRKRVASDAAPSQATVSLDDVQSTVGTTTAIKGASLTPILDGTEDRAQQLQESQRAQPAVLHAAASSSSQQEARGSALQIASQPETNTSGRQQPQENASGAAHGHHGPGGRGRPAAVPDPRIVRLSKELISVHPKGPHSMQQLLMEAKLTNPEVRQLLSLLGRSDAPEVALDAFRCMSAKQYQGWTQDPVLYTLLMQMFSRRAAWGPLVALDIFEEMRGDGVAPDLVAYNCALAAAGKAGRWGRLLEVLAGMEAAGVGRDAFTYTALLHACQLSGRWQQALTWFAELEAQAAQLQQEREGEEGGVESLEGAAGAGGSGAPAAELAVPGQHGREGAGTKVRHAATAGAEGAGDCSGGRGAAAAGEEWSAGTREPVSSLGGSGGEAVMAQRSEGGGGAHGLRAETSLPAQHGSMGQRQQQHRLAAGSGGDGGSGGRGQAGDGGGGPHVVAAGGVAVEDAQEGTAERVEGTAPGPVPARAAAAAQQQWRQRSGGPPPLSPNVVHYTSLMSVLQRAGRWEQALQVFGQMEGMAVQPDVQAYNSAIAACAKGRDWERAWALFADMRRAGLLPSTVSYNALISACERCGQVDRALEVFEKMQRKGRAPNAVTYNTLISTCGKGGRYGEAGRLHAEMRAAGVPDDVFTLSSLITACEKAGRWREAQQQFQEFKQRGIAPNTVSYNALISTLGSCGQWEAALQAFKSMREDPHPSVTPDVVTYGSLIAALERGGEWRQALQVYEEMRNGGRRANGYIITSLLNACEKGGQWDRAGELFKLMQDLDMGMDSMTMVARKALYTFPWLISTLPAPLVQAARAAVESGRAARRWIREKNIPTTL